ncbi:hypothetical protein [Novosphingobium guangzhouense]|uniref:Uncharacterized protein n=1 Tax=Novosphingobium guangzhouense TaxID=1850347 RepID=A0A2K2FT57_9SPHN|nr:hypothetical protein [Novosphingobium guangzhouense]PNU01975.1 hypothetical protein A8V01_11015 [Novosphingobium guangzhouense]
MQDVEAIIERVRRRSLLCAAGIIVAVLITCMLSGAALLQPVLLVAIAIPIWDWIWWRRKREFAMLVPVEECLAWQREDERDALFASKPAQCLGAILMVGCAIGYLLSGWYTGEVYVFGLVLPDDTLRVADAPVGYWLWMGMWIVILCVGLRAAAQTMFPRMMGPPRSFDGYWLRCDGLTFKP